MEKSVGKGTIRTAVAVCAVGFMFQCMQIASNIIADVSMQFPDIPITVIQMMVTLPPLFNFVATLLVGWLSLRISKKILIIIGLFIALAGGVIFTLFNNSFAMILVAAMLIGIGVGVFSTLVSAVTTDNFDGEKRARIMGIQNGMGSVGGLVIGLLATAFLTGGWRHLYYSYVLFIPVIIIAITCMPKDNPMMEVDGKMQQKAKLRDFKFTAPFVMNVIAIFLFFFSLITFLSNFAMYIVGGGLGDAATCGLVSNVMTVFCVISSMLAGPIGKVLKKFHLVVGMFCGALAMFIAYFTTDLAGMFVAIAVLGLGLGSSMPAALLNVSRSVPKEVAGVAFSILWGASTIGQVISPYIVNPISAAIGGDVLSNPFLVGGVVMAAAFIYTLIFQLVHKDKNTEMPPVTPAS